jgi:hypothetical protein
MALPSPLHVTYGFCKKCSFAQSAFHASFYFTECTNKNKNVFSRFCTYQQKIKVNEGLPLYSEVSNTPGVCILFIPSICVCVRVVFKQTIGNECVHEINNDSKIRVVKPNARKYLSQKYIHIYTWMSPDGKTQSILM